MQRLNQNEIIHSDNEYKINSLLQKIQIKHKCIGNNILNQFCVNKKCQNTIKFMCNEQKCKCHENHFQCSKKNIDSVLITINQKIYQNINKRKENISEIFTKLIDKISEFQQNCLNEVDNQLKFSNLTEFQSKFYSIFAEQKDEKFEQFSSQRLSQLSNIIEDRKNEKKDFNVFSKLFQQIQSYQKKSYQVIQITKTKIYNIFQTINKNFQVYDSSILLKECQLLNLLNFFDKKIKQINLVFKASQNNFEMQKYYQKCGNLQNTIILLQTDKNKVIGGYTPLIFYPVNNQTEYVTDTTGTSFLFSLTNNDKFQLKIKQYAICRNGYKKKVGFGPSFTFVIQNEANNNPQNRFNLIDKIYENQQYNDNRQSYLKLTGYQNEYFLAKQWEIFQVKFY